MDCHVLKKLKKLPAFHHLDFGTSSYVISKKWSVEPGLGWNCPWSPIYLSIYDASGCQSCVFGKTYRSTIPKQCSTKWASGLLDLNHTVLYVPIEGLSAGEATYFVTSVDASSSWIDFYQIGLNFETIEWYLHFGKPATQQSSWLIRSVRSDEGCEYLISELINYFSARSTEHKPNAAYASHQSGVAEQYLERELANLSHLRMFWSKC